MTTPTKEEALAALEDMDDYARMTCGVEAAGPYQVLKRFIEGEPTVLYRVWPDGTVQEVEGDSPYSHMSDDFVTVAATDEEDALRVARARERKVTGAQQVEFDSVLAKYASACMRRDRDGMREGYIALRSLLTAQGSV